MELARARALLAARPVWYRSAIETDHQGWGHWGLIAEELAEIVRQCADEYEHALKYRQKREADWQQIEDLYYGKKKKSLVTHESYANDSSDYGQRILTESFLTKRCRFAAHYLPRPNTGTPLPPAIKPVLTRDLKWLDYGDDVMALQAYLQAKGHMPTVWTDGVTPLPPTGLWKSITAQAVRKWQAANGITAFASSPDDAVKFGPESRKKLQAE
mgnify:CR=1 FL=1